MGISPSDTWLTVQRQEESGVQCPSLYLKDYFDTVGFGDPFRKQFSPIAGLEWSHTVEPNHTHHFYLNSVPPLSYSTRVQSVS